MRLLIGIALAALLLLPSGSTVFAADPSLPISQYAHTRWTVRDGSFRDSIGAIAQTPDGYLWLGTQFGLLRFDGVRYVLWEPPSGQQLPSINIRRLFAASDGRLWISTTLGLASWKDGSLTLHPEVTGQVGAILEDRNGTVWVGTRYPPPGKLCAYRADGVQCYGEKGEFGARASSIFEDRAGNLWVGSENALWRWKPGAPNRYPLVNFESSNGIVETDEGAIVVAERDRLRQVVGGKVVEYQPWINRLNTQFAHMLRTRDGALWIGTLDRGLIRVHQGQVDLFSRADGLSSNYVRGLFQDREGNIWVATDNGLDRFSYTAVSTISADHGLSEGTPWSVLPASDGSVWVGTVSGLNRLKDGRITVYRREGRPLPRDPPRSVRRVVIGAGLPHDLIQSLFEDSRQRIWVSTHRGVVVFEHGRFSPIAGLGSGVQAFAGDDADNVWVSEDATLTHAVDLRVVERIPWQKLGSQVPATAMCWDPHGGGLWLGFRDGSGVRYLKDGRIVASYDAANGLGRGIVGGLQVDADGTLWVSTEGGLSRIEAGRVHTLTARDGLPCDPVHWTIEDDDHAFWLYTACGLARVARSDLEAWAAETKRYGAATHPIKARLLDDPDGVRVHAMPGNYSPQVGKSVDGRLWFLPWDGVSVLDPRHLPFNALAPPVHIEQVTADRQVYAATPGLRLPSHMRDISIDFTALTFVAPEKVHFRYTLEGQDPEWKEVVNDRRVHYSNLPHGHYRFRVKASNNSGVWNEAGATLEFSIAPAYYQTRRFQAAIAVGSIVLLWVAYQLRIRQVARQFNRTLEARVGERTRIARDLHDTMLQSFQGALLRFQSVANVLATRPGEARERLERALDQAEAAITEGRDALQGLRSSSTTLNDLPKGIMAIGAELTSDPSASNPPAIEVDVIGELYDLNPAVRDEAYRITGEALRNAVKHAQARQIIVTIHYEARQLRVTIRDDGKGMDKETMRRQQPPGHFGLCGMRERAAIVHGRLEVRSAVGSGTEIELRVPGATAYGASVRPSWSRVFKRTNRHA